MNLKRTRRDETLPEDLVYVQMASHMAWRAQTRPVAECYRAWRRAETKERRFAFARYVAALDREERPAGDYQRTLELASQP
jgi:hypothetical protein